MQSVKDSFYMALRDRLSTLDPPRQLVVCENQRRAWLEGPDTFYMRWNGSAKLPADAQDAGWRALACDIGYRTEGSDLASGEDRGRQISALDTALLTAILPRTTPWLDYAQQPPQPNGDVILWTAFVLGDLETKPRGLQRTATLNVLWREEVPA